MDAGSLADAIVISDLHLGSEVCQAKRLEDFVEAAPGAARQLVLNGDMFDSLDFHRLKKHHWRVLSKLRKISDQIPVTWVCGNHDGQAEMLGQLLGLVVHDEHVVMTGGKSLLCLHGHQFDEFIEKFPVITWAADQAYRLLQWMDKTHQLARWAKTSSKQFLHNVARVKTQVVEYMRKGGHDLVCCGHTHHPESCPPYFNSGCWTEASCCSWLEVADGEVILRHGGINHSS